MLETETVLWFFRSGSSQPCLMTSSGCRHHEICGLGLTMIVVVIVIIIIIIIITCPFS
jgi:hypothetical protein